RPANKALPSLLIDRLVPVVATFFRQAKREAALLHVPAFDHRMNGAAVVVLGVKLDFEAEAFRIVVEVARAGGSTTKNRVGIVGEKATNVVAFAECASETPRRDALAEAPEVVAQLVIARGDALQGKLGGVVLVLCKNRPQGR